MSRRRSRKAGSDSDTDGSDDFDLEIEEAEGPQPPRRGRGRPPGSRKRGPGALEARAARQQQQVPLDENGKPYEIEDDELKLEVDEAGEKKVNSNGELQDGRQYRVRSFTIKNRGDRLYMLSTEPARCMGFRDSYLLFQKHRKLWKVLLTDEEKYDLIERDIIPHSYKGRVIGVVTARSVFREFGAKIVVGGKRVIDDYYEADAIAQGYVSGQIADPDDRLPPQGQPYNQNQYVAWHGASSVYHQSTSHAPTNALDLYGTSSLRRKTSVAVTDENWMFEHASAASSYNSALAKQRRKLLNPGGVYEPHVGLAFFPQSTQPTCVQWRRLDTQSNGSVTFSTVLHSENRVMPTGLSKLDPAIYECLDDDTKAQIQRQVQLETATL